MTTIAWNLLLFVMVSAVYFAARGWGRGENLAPEVTAARRSLDALVRATCWVLCWWLIAMNSHFALGYWQGYAAGLKEGIEVVVGAATDAIDRERARRRNGR